MMFARRTPIFFFLILLLLGLSAQCGRSQTAPAAAAKQPVAPLASTAAQAYTLPPGKLAQAVALGRIDATLDIAESLWGLVVLWLLLERRWAARLDAWISGIFAKRGWGGNWNLRWLEGLLFYAAFLVLTTLAALPLNAVGHAASRAYGLSVQSWGGWLLDAAKGLGLALVFVAPVLLFFHWMVGAAPRRYWLWCWLIVLPLAVFTVFSAPLLDPVFNQFEPLQAHHPALVVRLETLVARTGMRIPPRRMFLMKASKKYTGINAYVTGIGSTKRLVLWDTTVQRLPDDEILFIFGHESGHYVLHHIPKELGGMAVALFFIFWACAGVSGRLARRCSARWGLVASARNPLASRPGFLVLLLTFSVASLLMRPAANAFSRHFEHQADIYGQEAIHGLVPDPQQTAVAAFNHLGESWLEDPAPSPLVEFWEFDHPSVQERARFAAHYNPWANGGHGKYFRR